MELYEQGRLLDACEVFLQSVQADESNFLAHYNLACSMTLLRKAYDPSSFQADTGRSFSITLETILEHLAKAVTLDNSRQTRMVEDSDLDALDSVLLFHRIAGRSLTNPWTARELLPRIHWSLWISGGSETASIADIPPDGTIHFYSSGGFDLQLWNGRRRGSGVYKVEQDRLLLRFEKGGFGTVETAGKILENGVLFDKFDGNPLFMGNTFREKITLELSP